MSARERAPIPSRSAGGSRRRAKSGRSWREERSLWRLPIESRAAAWSILAIALVAMIAVITIGSALVVGRHRCAEICAEHEYAYKGYASGSWFRAGSGVCTCSKDGTLVKLPMRE